MSELAYQMGLERGQSERDALQARVEELEQDKANLIRVTGDLLERLDDALAPQEGQLSMHTYGQSPDWFVEAATLACYGTLRSQENDNG